jgi:hypothetical protein
VGNLHFRAADFNCYAPEQGTQGEQTYTHARLEHAGAWGSADREATAVKFRDGDFVTPPIGFVLVEHPSQDHRLATLSRIREGNEQLHCAPADMPACEPEHDVTKDLAMARTFSRVRSEYAAALNPQRPPPPPPVAARVVGKWRNWDADERRAAEQRAQAPLPPQFALDALECQRAADADKARTTAHEEWEAEQTAAGGASAGNDPGKPTAGMREQAEAAAVAEHAAWQLKVQAAEVAAAKAKQKEAAAAEAAAAKETKQKEMHIKPTGGAI